MCRSSVQVRLGYQEYADLDRRLPAAAGLPHAQKGCADPYRGSPTPFGQRRRHCPATRCPRPILVVGFDPRDASLTVLNSLGYSARKPR